MVNYSKRHVEKHIGHINFEKKAVSLKKEISLYTYIG